MTSKRISPSPPVVDAVRLVRVFSKAMKRAAPALVVVIVAVAWMVKMVRDMDTRAGALDWFSAFGSWANAFVTFLAFLAAAVAYQGVKRQLQIQERQLELQRGAAAPNFGMSRINGTLARGQPRGYYSGYPGLANRFVVAIRNRGGDVSALTLWLFWEKRLEPERNDVALNERAEVLEVPFQFFLSEEKNWRPEHPSGLTEEAFIASEMLKGGMSPIPTYLVVDCQDYQMQFCRHWLRIEWGRTGRRWPTYGYPAPVTCVKVERQEHEFGKPAHPESLGLSPALQR